MNELLSDRFQAQDAIRDEIKNIKDKFDILRDGLITYPSLKIWYYVNELKVINQKLEDTLNTIDPKTLI